VGATPLTVDAAQSLAMSYWRAMPHTFAAVASGGRWKPWRHLVYISRIVTNAIRKGGGRIIINCPPRHGKSELISFWTPAWFLDLFPDKRVMLTAYGDAFAADWGRKVRNEMATNPLCLTKLREDSASASRWHTPQDGGMVTAGVGGAISGRGGDLVILDDPVKNWQEAHSYVHQQRFRDWFTSTLYTRMEPEATMIVLMTRWNERDPTAYLLEDHADDWIHIRLPALAEEGDVLGRKAGEPLCPERYDVEALTAIRAGATAGPWAAMYQQAPQEFGEGRLYHQFTDRNIDDRIKLRDELPLHLSVDFNRRPHMHCVIGQYDAVADRLVAYDEIAQPGVKDARQAGAAFVDWIKRHGGWRWPELQLYGDATGQRENIETSESGWEVLRQQIVHAYPDKEVVMCVPPGNPPVADTLEAMHDVMLDVDGVPHYFARRCCECLIRDFRDMRQGVDKLIDKAQEMLSHASDAERYRVQQVRPVLGGFFEQADDPVIIRG